MIKNHFYRIYLYKIDKLRKGGPGSMRIEPDLSYESSDWVLYYHNKYELA